MAPGVMNIDAELFNIGRYPFQRMSDIRAKGPTYDACSKPNGRGRNRCKWNILSCCAYIMSSASVHISTMGRLGRNGRRAASIENDTCLSICLEAAASAQTLHAQRSETAIVSTVSRMSWTWGGEGSETDVPIRNRRPLGSK
jgi:hypothetical protein